MPVFLSMPEWGFLPPGRWKVLLPQGVDGEGNNKVNVNISPYINVIFQGMVCANPCPAGTFGIDCKDRCDCYNGALCDHVSGQCKCLPGFQGDKVGIGEYIFLASIFWL